MTDQQKYGVFLLSLIVVYIFLFFVFGGFRSSDAKPTVSSVKTGDPETMTDEQKEEAMADLLKQQPFQEMTDQEKNQEKQMIVEMNSKAQNLQQGTFASKAHATEGQATIVNDNGDLKLVFSDDFRVEAGPDLHVFLSGTSTPSDSRELHAVGDVDAGKLKATSGAQLYDLPDSIDFSVKSVVIYCVPFKVVFGYANF